MQSKNIVNSVNNFKHIVATNNILGKNTRMKNVSY